MRPSVSLKALSRLLLAIVVLAAVTGGGAAADPFRVELIPVDATAENAVAARAAAIEQGQRDGLGIVMSRLTSPRDAARLPDPARVDLDRVVRSYDIADEQVGSSQYVARINVSYNPGEVGRLLSRAGIAFVQPPSQPILVLPAMRTASGSELWGYDDPWRAAWVARSAAGSGELLDLVLPLGDVEDIATFPQQALESGDALALANLTQRYEASAAYVVSALLPPGDVVENAPVRIEVWGPALGDPLGREVVPAGPGTTAAERLAPVVAAAVSELEAAWKTQNLAPSSRVAKLLVDVPLADLQGWIQTRRELETLPLVRSLRIDSLARAQASLTIDYLGELQQFESAVARLGFALTQENDRWRLLPAGGPVVEQAPAVTPSL